jgi:hypothetical protein
MHDESTSRRALDSERARQWYLANRERAQERQRRYYLANREKFLEQRKRRYDEEHATRGQIATECACGCGKIPTVGNRFVQGHTLAKDAHPHCPRCDGYPSAWRANRCDDPFHDANAMPKTPSFVPACDSGLGNGRLGTPSAPG